MGSCVQLCCGTCAGNTDTHTAMSFKTSEFDCKVLQLNVRDKHNVQTGEHICYIAGTKLNNLSIMAIEYETRHH